MRFANALLAVAVVVFPLAGCNAILGLGSFKNCKGGDVDESADCASGGGGPGGAGHGGSTSSSTTGSSTSNGGAGGGPTSKINPDGTVAWAKGYANATFLAQLAVDSNGDAILSGAFQSSIVFGSTTLNGPANSLSLYLAKLSGADGHALWAKAFTPTGTGGSALPYSLALDSSDDIYLGGGGFGGTLAFGGTATIHAQGTNDGYLAKLDPSGGGVWAKQFSAGGTATVISISLDSMSNVLMGGYFTGSIYVDNFSLSANGSNFFIGKLSAAGNGVWAKRFGDSMSMQTALFPKAISNDDVAIAGYFDSTLQFGGATTLLQSNGSEDAVLAVLDSGGVYRWSKSFGDAGSQFISGLAYDPMRQSIAIAGSMTAGTIDLGTGPVNAPAAAAYVAEFEP